MTLPILAMSSIHAGYGPVEVLKDVSLSVLSGELVTIIGANGAGKSTLLRCLTGLCEIRRGQALYRSNTADADEHTALNLAIVPAHELPGHGLVHVPEGRRIFPRLTVRENLELGGYSRPQGVPDQVDIDSAFSLFPILKDRQRQMGGTLSGGEQQMLAIARALMAKPKMLLLDEPSMGVAPLFIERIFDVITRLNRGGMTMILVEQNAHLALEVAHRAYVLETGTVILEGAACELRSDARVRSAYLGE